MQLIIVAAVKFLSLSKFFISLPKKFWFCPNTFLSLPEKFKFCPNFENLGGIAPVPPSRYGYVAKTIKPFTTGEELILPTRTDICREVFGELAAKKIAQARLSARIVTRRLRIWWKTLKLNCYSVLLRHHGLRFSVMSQPIFKT